MEIPFDIKFRLQIESGEYEEKQLLLIDLCARLPYGVKAQYNNKKEIFGDVEQIEASGDIDLSYYDEETERWKLCCTSIDNIKPYLRPMSSMTEEEREEYWKFVEHRKILYDNGSYDGARNILRLDIPNRLSDFTDWLNSHHFDYRSLIPMGLALEAKEGMYKTE